MHLHFVLPPSSNVEVAVLRRLVYRYSGRNLLGCSCDVQLLQRKDSSSLAPGVLLPAPLSRILVLVCKWCMEALPHSSPASYDQPSLR